MRSGIGLGGPEPGDGDAVVAGVVKQRGDSDTRVIRFETLVKLVIAGFGIISRIEPAEAMKVGPSLLPYGIGQGESDPDPLVVLLCNIQSPILNLADHFFDIVFYHINMCLKNCSGGIEIQKFIP